MAYTSTLWPNLAPQSAAQLAGIGPALPGGTSSQVVDAAHPSIPPTAVPTQNVNKGIAVGGGGTLNPERINPTFPLSAI